MKKLLFFLTILLGSVVVGSAQITQVGLIGTAADGSFTDVKMFSFDRINFIAPEYTLKRGTLSFRQDNTIMWGAKTLGQGIAIKNDESIIFVVEPGVYDIEFNVVTGAYSVIRRTNGVISPIGIYGMAAPITDIDKVDIDMTTTDGISYELKNQPLVVGGLKFRQDNAWLVNWASPSFPTGTGTQSGLDIMVNKAGNYDITFKKNIDGTGSYTFTLVGGPIVVDPVIAPIGIIGTAVTGGTVSDIDLTSTDGVTYILKNQALVVGNVKFRQDNAWTINWGSASFPTGTGVQNGLDIKVATAGTYDITFNKTTGAYDFKLVSVPVVVTTVSLEGTAIGNTPVVLTSTDKITYTVTGLLLTAGGAKIKVTEGDVISMMSGTAFPTGIATVNTGSIPVTAGKYDVSFNKTTGAYTFTLIDPIVVDPVIAPIGIIGTAVTGGTVSDIDLTSTDGVTYILKNQALVVGNVKFRQDNAWAINWGSASFPTGTGVQNGLDIKVATAGTYDITFNKTTGAYDFKLVSVPVVVTTVSLEGTAIGNTPVVLTSTDKITYTATGLLFTAGGAKIKVTEGDVISMMSGTAFPTGIATVNTGSIPVTAGKYDVSFNKTTGAYTFTLIDPIVVDPVIAPIGIIGTAVGGWATDIDMISTDGVVYTLMNQEMTIGEAKFRQDNLWVTSWGAASFPTGTAILNANINIAVTKAGKYNITFNKTTGVYDFKLVGDPIVVDPVIAPIGIIGTSVGGWTTDIDMISTDGVVYTLANQAMTIGEVKFRQDNLWVTSWGGATAFPTGKAVLNAPTNIPVTTAGNYNITFNKTTGEYNFETATLGAASFDAEASFVVYPNPVTEGVLYFSVAADVTVYDISGRLVTQVSNATELNVSNLNRGVYFVKTSNGVTTKVIVK